LTAVTQPASPPDVVPAPVEPPLLDEVVPPPLVVPGPLVVLPVDAPAVDPPVEPLVDPLDDVVPEVVDPAVLPPLLDELPVVPEVVVVPPVLQPVRRVTPSAISSVKRRAAGRVVRRMDDGRVFIDLEGTRSAGGVQRKIGWAP
jgi:hypothetical protein